MKKTMAILISGILLLTAISISVSAAMQAPAQQQQDWGFIAGVVRDQKGNPLKGAKITATGGGYTISDKSDGNGEYLLSVPGNIYYDVEATKFLYKSDSEDNAFVPAGETIILDFVLISLIPDEHSQPIQQLPQ